ncbi:DUF1559 family PulG-like putative transporter [Bremerella alba]|uniref:DUF1559 domain-containing protein n=1 Tax=Bremerella alba TaxID=980252 RepID=A0A7V8V4G3_9BACT|nr:DUF1559 domain-containing protein [Bremerella alba]MBA2114768.1 hypothetical protein [Bremerella alba]
MTEPSPFDSPQAFVKEPESKQWWKLTVTEVLVIIFIIAVLLGLLLPPITSQPRINSRIDQSMNQMNNIGYALQSYHDTYDCLPPAVVTDADGQPLYSWRVLILPFIEQKNLYDQFDLSQPWDSKTNGPLAEQVPYPLESPFLGPSAQLGVTTYLAVVDPAEQRTLMLAHKGGILDEVPCLLGEASLVVEHVGRPVIWTKPEDISPFELIAQPPIDQNGDSKCPVLLGDGSVRVLDAKNQSQFRNELLCEEVAAAEDPGKR